MMGITTVVVMPVVTVSSMPVSMIPRIIAGSKIDIGAIIVVIVIGSGVVIIVRGIIAAVVGTANSHADTDMHMGHGLAGKTDYPQQGEC